MMNKKQHAQKVLIRAINECLRARIFTLDPQERNVPASVHEFEMEGIQERILRLNGTDQGAGSGQL